MGCAQFLQKLQNIVETYFNPSVIVNYEPLNYDRLKQSHPPRAAYLVAISWF